MRELRTTIEPALKALLRAVTSLGLALWTVVRVPVLFVLQLLAALVLIFEEWGWKPLSDALARLARFRIFARIEQSIAMLPPYGALAAFAVPVVVLMPLKFVALWLLANGFFVSAGALFLGAKVASTALVARIFLLTKPALMRIGWFARGYNWLMPWKDAIFARIRASFAWRYGRMLKNAVRLEVKQAYARWKPWFVAQWQIWAPRTFAKLREFPQQVREQWRMWQPRARAELTRWAGAARRTWQRLIGVA